MRTQLCATFPHLVNYQNAQVVQQAAVASKSKEIPLVQQILTERDLHGGVFTMDALHAQRVNVRHIVEQGGTLSDGGQSQ